MTENTVTAWISDLKAGDDDAAAQLWSRFFQRLIHLAQRQLQGYRGRVADEEDVALSVFDSLCKGAMAGRFDRLSDRDDLWRLLVVMTCHKSNSLQRWNARQKRGGGNVRGESAFEGDNSGDFGINQFAANGPTPEFLVELDDTFDVMMQQLKTEDTRQVAQLRIHGCTNEEIADELSMSVSSVERKLRLVRQTWMKVLAE